MRQFFKKIGPNIDTKSKLEFEAPVFEIFGDLGANLEVNQKVFKSWDQVGGVRASSEGEGEAKA